MTPLRITRRQKLAALLLAAAICGAAFVIKYGSPIR